MLRIMGRIMGIRDDGKEEEEDGGRGQPRASHLVAWEELWWENGFHHYRATQLSEHVTGLGLSWLCITPSTKLKNLRWTASETTTQTDRRHQSSYHLFPSSLFCFLVLANQLSRCDYSLPTLLETKPPFS
jgi:hypothetical protein